METCPSGLKVPALKAVGEGFARGFESHRLRHRSLFLLSSGGSISPILPLMRRVPFFPVLEGFSRAG